MFMWIDKGYFEQLFWKKPTFNIKFGKKPILAQNSPNFLQERILGNYKQKKLLIKLYIYNLSYIIL